MATLDDKLLGEKLHYYCSSSESEADDEDGSDDQQAPAEMHQSKPAPVSEWQGSSTNTGPKGVIKDYQRFKQLEREKSEEKKQELAALTKKLALTCRTDAEDRKAEEQEMDEEFSELFSDALIHQFVEQRMKEMMSLDSQRKVFGRVQHLNDANEFLDAVDGQDEGVTVLVLLFEPNGHGCPSAVHAVTHLAQAYVHFKWCTVRPSFISMSGNFKEGGVPALLAYRAGQVVGNFVKLTNDLGHEFETCDLEGYLIEHGILNDRKLIPAVTSCRDQDSSSDDD